MASQANHPLPCGTTLDAYRIERLLSVGGFSIVYLATDAHGNPVVIKEYLPATLALRREGDILPSVKPEKRSMFLYGMKCFFEEGSALAKLHHPNVVRVVNFFRANDTVYLVMDYERGITLQDYIRKHKGEISERFLRGAFTRLLNGLREVHSHKLLHLDIKPSNIYLRLDGNPVLLDFGAARQTLASGGKMLKPMYTPGFAAPEQYESRELLGPWSDIYSIGASLYACLGGTAPQAANARVGRDQVPLAAKRFADKYSQQLLELIDWCMRLDHLDRPQSVFTLQKVLAVNDAPAPTTDFLSTIVRRIRHFKPK